MYMPGRTADILGVGVATIDDLLTVERFPEVNEKQRLLTQVRQCGGLTGSALVAASRLGVGCSYIITLGDGELSSFTRDRLTAEGINLIEDGFQADAEPFHSFIIVVQSTGDRSIIWRNDKTLPPRIGTAELRLAAEAGCLFVDHVFAADIVGMAEAARRAGRAVVGDFERDTPRSAELMDLTDHLILPLAQARRVLGKPSIPPEEAVSALAARPGKSLACVTDSERGSWFALGGNPCAVSHQPCFSAGEVIDSTGCGDVFHGAYAAGLILGWSPAERIRRAAAAAALKTLKPGAQAGAPTLAELEAFLVGSADSI
jgi:ribokinase